MKRKMTLQKVAIAMITGVVGMSGALLHPFSAEATVKVASNCHHTIFNEYSGISNFCKEVGSEGVCKMEVGLGSFYAVCGEC